MFRIYHGLYSYPPPRYPETEYYPQRTFNMSGPDDVLPSQDDAFASNTAVRCKASSTVKPNLAKNCLPICCIKHRIHITNLLALSLAGLCTGSLILKMIATVLWSRELRFVAPTGMPCPQNV